MKTHHPVALLLGVVLAVAGSGVAWGQSIIFTPSLTIGESYDDNVFLSSTNRQSDFVTALTPGLRLEIKDYPWYVSLAGSARGELYATQSELNNFGDNASGNMSVEFRPTPLLTVSLTDTLARSLNPSDVNPAAGLPISGRSVSTNNTVTPAMTYQINPVTLLGLQYSLTSFRSDSPGALDSDTQVAEFSVQRQFSPRNSGIFRYTFNHFQVEGNPDQDSHFPRVGIIHAFSPTIRVSADVGPIFLENPDGSWEVAVGGGVRYAQQFRRGTLSIALDRAPQLAGNIGQAGITDSLTTTTNFPLTTTMTLALNSVISYTEPSHTNPDLRVLSNGIAINYQPLRLLSMDLQFSMSDNRSSDGTTDFLTYSGGGQVKYQVFKWLSIQGGYNFQQQDDKAGTTNNLQHNVFFLGLTASDQFRAY